VMGVVIRVRDAGFLVVEENPVGDEAFAFKSHSP